MTTENKKPEILSFAKWLKTSGCTTSPNEEKECEDCDGTGYKHCTACDNENDCDTCDGTGMANLLDEEYQAYQHRITQDLKKWEEHHAAITAERVSAGSRGQGLPEKQSN